jgi:LuxR family maltose regulon positive regulatory protein
VTALQRRAAAWFAGQGLLPEAVEYALAGQDWATAADLIRASATDLVGRGQQATLHRWLTTLPGEIVRARPLLVFDDAVARILLGRPHEAERLIQGAEEASQGDHSGPEAAARGRALALGSVLAAGRLEGERAQAWARRSLTLLPREDLAGRAGALAGLGRAQVTAGDLDAAERTLREAVDLARASGNLLDGAAAATCLAWLEAARGRLYEAAAQFRAVLSEAGEAPVLSRYEAACRLAPILVEWDELAEAERRLSDARRIGPTVGIGLFAIVEHLSRARLLRSAGRFPEAVSEAGRAAVAARRHRSAGYERLARAEQAHAALRRGDLEAADAWAAGLGPAGDLLSYPREPEALVLTRLWIARGRADEALRVLGELLVRAEAAGRLASVVEVQVLRALALTCARRPPEALAALGEAVRQAEPGGFLRVFLDEGETMVRLLRRAVADGHVPPPHPRLLAAIRPQTTRSSTGGVLSAREREVLELLAQGRTNREIGEALVITQNTVKAHLHHIATKLDASNRTTILARARAWGLLDRA